MTEQTIVTRGRGHDRPRPDARPGMRSSARAGRRAADTLLSGDVHPTSPFFIADRP